MRRFRRSLTFANVCSFLALTIAVTGGTAYAANEFTGANIVDGSLTRVDLATNTINSGRITDGTIGNVDLAANAVTGVKVTDKTIGKVDLSANAVTGIKVTDGTLNGDDIADNAVKGADVDEATLGLVPYSDTSNFAFSVGSNSVGPAQLIQNPKWHFIGDAGEPGFLNGWTNYDTHTVHTEASWSHAGYMKDHLGVVHLTGLVKGGAGAVFRLPDGYCPWYYRPFPVLANNALGRVTVEFMQPSCQVIVEFGNNSWVSLDGISYRDGYEEYTLSAPQMREEMARRRALVRSGAAPGELP